MSQKVKLITCNKCVQGGLTGVSTTKDTKVRSVMSSRLQNITLCSAMLPSSPGAPGEPASDPAPSRERAHDRGRSHERKHHHSSADKQRYYSCDRYCSREHCHTKSATASCAASPSEGQEISNKQVGGDMRVEYGQASL